MSPHTQRVVVAGPSGPIECALDDASAGHVVGTVVVCHPHPQHGGTMDNKVVQTVARGLQHAGIATLRFNFRGVGGSEGRWDDGRGEVDDALAVVDAMRRAGEPLLLAGFSFGAYVASQAAARLAGEARPQRLVLVGPSTQKQQMPAVPADTAIHHSEADDVVPVEWSHALCDRLEALSAAGDVPHAPECWFYEAQPHTFRGDGDALFIERTIEFLGRN